MEGMAATPHTAHSLRDAGGEGTAQKGAPRDPRRAAPPRAPRRARTRRRRRSPGWVPDYHGAWAMIIVPPLVGIWLSGPTWLHLPLVALWWVGYFLFFAAGLWLRSRFKKRYLPPVRAFGIATAVLAVLLLVTAPWLVVWALPFAPLVALTAGASWNRADRSMLNDTVTVGAAGLMTAVAYDAGTGGAGGLWGTGRLAGTGFLGAPGHPAAPGPTPDAPGTVVDAAADPAAILAALPGSSFDGSLTGWGWAWLVTLIVFAYFLGTVFYVKTNIRERESRGWLVASIAYHAVLTVFVAVFVAFGLLHWSHLLVWLALTARAAAVPMVRAREGTWLNGLPAKRLAMVIGLGEVFFSIVVPVTLLLSAG